MRLALLASCWGIVCVLALQAKDPEDQLRRRAMLGARLAIASDEVRQRQQLGEEVGVVLEHIFPGTSYVRCLDAGRRDSGSDKRPDRHP